MIKTLRTMTMTLVLFASAASFAGGVFCKECPAENENCMPKACPNMTKDSQAKCTNGSAINQFLKPVAKTAAAACCSWSEVHIPDCMKGC